MVRNTAELSQEIMRHPLRLVRKLYTSCQLTNARTRLTELLVYLNLNMTLSVLQTGIMLFPCILFGKIEWKGIKWMVHISFVIFVLKTWNHLKGHRHNLKPIFMYKNMIASISVLKLPLKLLRLLLSRQSCQNIKLGVFSFFVTCISIHLDNRSASV